MRYSVHPGGFLHWFTPIVYIIGFIALWFHLNHGFWSMFQSSVGITSGLPASKKMACWWSNYRGASFIAQAIVFTVKAHENYYKTNETLREPYKEMLAPMFEKDGRSPMQLGLSTSAPFDQMNLDVLQRLSQIADQLSEAQSIQIRPLSPRKPSGIAVEAAAEAFIDYLHD